MSPLSPLQDHELFARHLAEALPYIQHFSGQTVVIKYGGHAMDSTENKNSFIRDVVLLRYVGIKPILVHGGGPQITELMKRLGKVAEFVEGQRVTDMETVEVAEMVLSGTVGKEMVALINRHGGQGVSLSGKDGNLLKAVKHSPKNKDGDILDLGYVGKVEKVNPELLVVLDDHGFIPVISPLGVGDDGHTYNINADVVAGEIAAALAAEKLILMTDTPGILRDQNNVETLISSATLSEIDELIADGTITSGMLPKVGACRCALEAGVNKAHIIDGRESHCLLLELFTTSGIGTEIIK